MNTGETITYKGVTYEVKQNDGKKSIYPCEECDLRKDFLDPYGEDEIEEVCDWECFDYNLYLKRKENQ